jgi:hypothetical protein
MASADNDNKDQSADETNLKGWMRKEDIYDNDLYEILQSQGVENPLEDFKGYTQTQWDELWRRGNVERAKELKDQKAKVRLEKKLVKLEKYWRKQSGVQKSSINKEVEEKEAPPLDNSAQAQKDALKQGAELKKFLQKNQCFNPDLLMVLVGMSICCEDDIVKIDSNSTFDEVYRQVRVLRAKELKDQAAKVRMEKLMAKFEKLWRDKTGIKKSSIKGAGPKGTKKKDPKSVKNEELNTSGATLKQWMKKNDVWEMALYDELMANNISNPEELAKIDEDKFDEIVRKVRVDRFSQLKDQAARNRADKLLVRFEKEWRKSSGIKKTSIK